MSAHVLVPVKRLEHAKTRLAAELAPVQRAGLVREMLELVLAAAAEARVGPITVVSSEPLALNGTPRFDDGGLEWNAALARAMREVVAEDVAAIVSGDLPRLGAGEVRALIEATPERGIAIGRAKDGGTNALAMRPRGAIATSFGEPASAEVHEQAAKAAGVASVVLDLPGLAFDVDTAEDLAAWRR